MIKTVNKKSVELSIEKAMKVGVIGKLAENKQGNPFESFDFIFLVYPNVSKNARKYYSSRLELVKKLAELEDDGWLIKIWEAGSHYDSFLSFACSKLREEFLRMFQFNPDVEKSKRGD